MILIVVLLKLVRTLMLVSHVNHRWLIITKLVLIRFPILVNYMDVTSILIVTFID